ncbi:PEP/pyruvate-binding domain-containing protein [Actinoplanes sp. NPDC024001]|uniref:PEP/pyruvate-binding domain-containing protein n=1 Tax=Actinoplanes sp. NPDC024001 TaxID=3154598 RepID=UPI00340D9225
MEQISGGKAATLARLSAAGLAVPPAVTIRPAELDDPAFDTTVRDAARRLGSGPFAVRSSALAEDLPDASFAGLYETYLDVGADELPGAVRRCFAAATADRVRAYRGSRAGGPAGMTVLIQVMVDAAAAGVAFTADPVTGDRQRTVVTAVAGLGEPLVSGETGGEEWAATATGTALTRPAADGTPVLTRERATAVAALARRVEEHCGGPQDVEWAFDRDGRLWLLQARPMTAVPEPAAWDAPGPGLWMRNFRLGEWLPEAVTPLFATWLLPALEAGFLDGMRQSIGVVAPFRYALVNGWYYNATPIPDARLLAGVLRRGRTVRILYHALIGVGRDPVAADRAVLTGLHRQWRDEQLPRYRRLVAGAREESVAVPQLPALIDALAREAGAALWFLAIVGGSAWKMEACLTRFCRRHLPAVLDRYDGGAQVLLRGLPGTMRPAAGHEVYTLDWFHPTAGESPRPAVDPDVAVRRGAELTAQRERAERECAAALAARPRLLAAFRELLAVTQRYAVIREEQARLLTLAWPVLRACVRRLGEHLGDDAYFCTRDELTAGSPAPPVAERRERWQRQRRLAAPLTLGRPPRLVGDVIERTVTRARGPAPIPAGMIAGHPASAGRATGPARILTGPAEFAALRDGEVLVAKATTPAWTPLFARAAAVVTDTGSLAAHASLIAREYGIPAVVGTGDATHRLRTGQRITVDGTAGTVTVHPLFACSDEKAQHRLSQ